MIRITVSLFFALLVGIGGFCQTEISADKLKEHLFFLASDELEGRGWSTPSGRKAAEYIASYFDEIGLVPIGDDYLHSFYSRNGQTMLIGQNVVGMVEGSDPELKDEYIVLGAHYDHISYKLVEGKKIVYNGADDNASGTATVMEIGKALVDGKAKLKRSVILVAFDAEESGLIGSGQFVRQEIVPIDQIKVMFSIDMVGRLAESNSVTMGALDNLKGATDILLTLAKEKDIKIKKTGGGVSFRTDTKPFGDAGVPAVYVTTGIIGPYHKPEDDPETLDYDGMAKISNLLTELTVTLANEKKLAPVPLVAAQTNKTTLPFFRYGVKTNLGASAHIYPDEFYKAKSNFSGELGFLTQFKLSNNFAIQPELLYSTMASRIGTGHFRAHSVSLPLSLVLASTMEPSLKQRFFFSAGAYYSYYFAGRMAKQAVDFTNTYNPQEIGLVIGGGLEIMSVMVNVHYKRGFTSLLKDSNAGPIMSRGLYLTFGYLF